MIYSPDLDNITGKAALLVTVDGILDGVMRDVEPGQVVPLETLVVRFLWNKFKEFGKLGQVFWSRKCTDTLAELDHILQ